MDKGHHNLVGDLRDLLADAEQRQFHDFNSNSKYAAPKTALIARLETMISFIQQGRYDNDPE